MTRTRYLVLCVLASAAFDACAQPVAMPDVVTPESCEPESRVACECADGTISSERCGSAGRYLACECAIADATTPADATDVADGREASTPFDANDDAADAPADTGLDVSFDVAMDARDSGASDAPSDAPRDAWVDAGRDVSTDGCVRARCSTAGCGLVDDGCGGTIACACEVDGVIAGRLVWDAPHAVAYVAVRQNSSLYPNTVVAFDPISASVQWALPIGSDPFPIALADDGHTAWVGLVGANAVRRFDVTNFSVEPQRTLPPGYGSISAPIELAPVPSTPTGVFVSMQANGDLYGTSANHPAQVIMDDAIPRGGVITTFDGNAITGGPSGLVYGFDNISTGYEFVVMEMGPRGITGMPFSGLVSGFGTTIRYAAGRVFASTGTVLDVTTDPRAPRVATTLPAGFVYVDAAAGYGYLLAPSSPCSLSRFSLDTYVVDQRVSCGGFRHDTIADLTRVAPGRYIAVGVPDRFGPRGALYTFEAPF